MSHIAQGVLGLHTLSTDKYTERMQSTYEKFLNDPEPLSIFRELAQLRTLMSSLLEQSQAVDQHIAVSKKIAAALEKESDENDGQLDMPSMISVINKVLIANSPTSNMSDGYIRSVTTLVETIGKTAERAKKIQDGIRLKIDWSPDIVTLLRNFVAVVVIKYVLPEHRDAFITAAKDFLKIQDLTPSLPQAPRKPSPPPPSVKLPKSLKKLLEET